MSDVNIIEEYRALMASLLNNRITDDERKMCLNQLAEMRAGYQAGMWAEEKATGVEQAPSKGRLVWVDDDWQDYLVLPDHGNGSAVCVVCVGWVAHYPGGRGDYDKTETCPDRATALRTAAEWARADGYECDDHPDAAPATADAPPLPPSR